MNIYPMVIANIQMNSVTGFISILMLIMLFSVSLINTCMSVMYVRCPTPSGVSWVRK